MTLAMTATWTSTPPLTAASGGARQSGSVRHDGHEDGLTGAPNDLRSVNGGVKVHVAVKVDVDT